MKKLILISLLIIGCNNTTGESSMSAEEYFDRGYSKHQGIGEYDYDYEGAIEDFNKAIEIDPNYARAYLYRGEIKSFFDDYYGAIEDYTKAIELGTLNREENSGAYYLRGTNKFYMLDDKVGACEDYEQAAYLGNTNAWEDYDEKCN